MVSFVIAQRQTKENSVLRLCFCECAHWAQVVIILSRFISTVICVHVICISIWPSYVWSLVFFNNLRLEEVKAFISPISMQ